jgi:hypothetical protein
MFIKRSVKGEVLLGDENHGLFRSGLIMFVLFLLFQITHLTACFSRMYYCYRY